MAGAPGVLVNKVVDMRQCVLLKVRAEAATERPPGQDHSAYRTYQQRMDCLINRLIQPVVATGRVGSVIHSLQEPAYRRGSG